MTAEQLITSAKAAAQKGAVHKDTLGIESYAVGFLAVELAHEKAEVARLRAELAAMKEREITTTLVMDSEGRLTREFDCRWHEMLIQPEPLGHVLDANIAEWEQKEWEELRQEWKDSESLADWIATERRSWVA